MLLLVMCCQGGALPETTVFTAVRQRLQHQSQSVNEFITEMLLNIRSDNHPGPLGFGQSLVIINDCNNFASSGG